MVRYFGFFVAAALLFPLAAGPNEDLYKGCFERDVTLVKTALKNGADPNYAYPAGIALHVVSDDDLYVKYHKLGKAKEAEHMAMSYLIAKMLLAKGAQVNLANSYGSTAIGYAAGAGKLSLVKLFLANGADTHANYEGALRSAARMGRTEIVRLLLTQEGVDVNARPPRGESFGRVDDAGTALITAARKGHIEVAKLLIARGADLNATMQDGLLGEVKIGTALDWARDEKKTEMVSLLEQAGATKSELKDAPENATYDRVGHSGTMTAEEQKLYELIMNYRRSKNLPAIPASSALTLVAHIHVRDLDANPPSGSCNFHSWSNKGKWSACCYTADHAQAQCMWRKPSQLTFYYADGYEIAAWRSGGVWTPEAALAGWQGSPGHNAVMINEGTWASKNWRAIGVAIYGSYAVVWFGDHEDATSK